MWFTRVCLVLLTRWTRSVPPSIARVTLSLTRPHEALFANFYLLLRHYVPLRGDDWRADPSTLPTPAPAEEVFPPTAPTISPTEDPVAGELRASWPTYYALYYFYME